MRKLTEKAMGRLTAIYDDLQKKVQNGRLGNLTPLDIKTAVLLGKELVKQGTTSTINSAVAEYYRHFGCMVTLDFNKINYIIVA